MKRQRAESQHVMNTRQGAVTEAESPAAVLWSAIRTERRVSIERATLRFGQCGWLQGNGKQEQRA